VAKGRVRGEGVVEEIQAGQLGTSSTSANIEVTFISWYLGHCSPVDLMFALCLPSIRPAAAVIHTRGLSLAKMSGFGLAI